MEGIDPIGSLWFDAIGFSVYSYEGIGVILPIREVTACKDDYFKLLCIKLFLPWRAGMVVLPPLPLQPSIMASYIRRLSWVMSNLSSRE